MVVSDVEAVCRSEAQRVLTHLRGNRKFGSLSRGWRELGEGSPIRQLSEWRCGSEASPAALLEPLLRIVRSPEFAGPSTYVALEAAHAVLTALCESRPPSAADVATAGILAQVSNAVCECVFEETHAQMDEAAAMQMIAVLGLCASAPAGADAAAFPAAERGRAFAKVLSLWEHYRQTHVLRAFAQSTLQRMLDAACADLRAHSDFLRLVLSRVLFEVEQGIPVERAVLYLRCLQRLTTHPSARQWSVAEGPQACLFQEVVPMVLLRISDKLGTNITVLSLLLPIVNRICWLCVDHWVQAASTGENGHASCLGALQVEALMSSVYLRILLQAAAPLQSSESASVSMTMEEGSELLVVLLEGLSDLLEVDTVRTVWLSFDADWRRPALLEQVVQCIADIFRDAPSTERQLPAHIVHLSTTVLSRVVAAFDAAAAPPAAAAGSAAEFAAELELVRQQWRRREAVVGFMAKLEESPKKARATLEKSGLMDFVPLPESPCKSSSSSSPGEPEPEEWVAKLTWVFRCLNHAVPYAAMGEFFGQPKDDAKQAFAAFVDTFDMGAANLDEALREFLQAFRLPGEAQQIDRVLQAFGDAYFRKHVEYCRSSDQHGTGFLRSADAAYTLAFSCIMLNVDQHNPKLKKRMVLADFLRNNRNTNDGENFPEDVQTRIFENIRQNEIKTPSSGSMMETVSPARIKDFLHLIRKGYRDNALAGLRDTPSPYVRGFLERMGERVRTALEYALAMDVGANSDALQGLEQLWHLTLRHKSPEADSVAEGLFFFGTEVFHETQRAVAVGRASACLRALFRTALGCVEGMSTRQLHMMVYLTVQFALYGFLDRTLPPNEPKIAKLLRIPSLVVDPPTGVVYSFLRKISTAPFKMLSYAEDAGSSAAPAPSPRPSPAASPPGSASEAETVATQSPQDPDPSPGRDEQQRPLLEQQEAPPGEAATSAEPAPAPAASPREGGAGAEEPSTSPQRSLPSQASGSPAAAEAPAPAEAASLSEEAALQDNPLRPQIEVAFEACSLDAFTRVLVSTGHGPAQQGEREDKPEAAEGAEAEEAAERGAAAQVLLNYLCALFLALRCSASCPKIPKDQDLPWWPEPPTCPNFSPPQALQLPKRALALNVFDGYETLRLALRLTQVALGGAQEARSSAAAAEGCAASTAPTPIWEPTAVQEFAVCAHVGLFHTLRRSDLSERALRAGIATVFQVAATLLTLHTAQGPAVSTGWPVRLMEVLIRRADGEPQMLVPVARLCLEASRSFVIEVSRSRVLDNVELWRHLLLLQLKAMPTGARALWSSTIHREVEVVQGRLWKRGIVWVLGHPQLLDCLGAEDLAAAKGGTSATNAEGSGAFWGWVLPELATLAHEIAGGTSNRVMAMRLLLDAYGTLLLSIGRAPSAEEHALAGEDPPPPGGEANAPAAEPPIRANSAPAALQVGEANGVAPSEEATSAGPAATAFGAAFGAFEPVDPKRTAALSSAWSRVAISLLSLVGPFLTRASGDDNDLQILPLLKHTLLSVRVPMLLGGAAQGPYWARLVLEKLVSMLTNGVNAGAPLAVVRDAVSLVAKFFLQNLHTLQRHEQFGQSWLMVLRLMLLFAKRGSDDRDTELEEIAVEALKNLLKVLLSMRVLGFTARKASGAAAAPGPSPAASPRADWVAAGSGGAENPPVWWQMTWDCIEVFLPGFGEEFSKSAHPKEEVEEAPAPSEQAPSAEA